MERGSFYLDFYVVFIARVDTMVWYGIRYGSSNQRPTIVKFQFRSEFAGVKTYNFSSVHSFTQLQKMDTRR